jgi:hypothetical protein
MGHFFAQRFPRAGLTTDLAEPAGGKVDSPGILVARAESGNGLVSVSRMPVYVKAHPTHLALHARCGHPAFKVQCTRHPRPP